MRIFLISAICMIISSINGGNLILLCGLDEQGKIIDKSKAISIEYDAVSSSFLKRLIPEFVELRTEHVEQDLIVTLLVSHTILSVYIVPLMLALHTYKINIALFPEARGDSRAFLCNKVTEFLQRTSATKDELIAIIQAAHTLEITPIICGSAKVIAQKLDEYITCWNPDQSVHAQDLASLDNALQKFIAREIVRARSELFCQAWHCSKSDLADEHWTLQSVIATYIRATLPQ